MSFRPVKKLQVHRTLMSGVKVLVGTLAQNRQGVFFQYAQSYLDQHDNLSPFGLRFDNSVQAAPHSPHAGLHGLFADSLPDGWGLLLQDRVFRQHDLLPNTITAMDRLAFVGNSALGALSFSPTSDYVPLDQGEIDLATLGLNAQAVFDGQTEDVLAQLVAAGGSGGARPKAQVYFQGIDYVSCRTKPLAGDDAWLVKFTSASLPLGHEEGLCEAAYLTLAAKAKLNPPKWQLLDAPQASGARQWLATQRFDYVRNSASTSGRQHFHSACGLLDADFRTPSLDYDDLIKATKILCKSPAYGQLQFKRAIFNLLTCNQDDHSKNWGFLLDGNGAWHPAPFYDIIFNPSAFNEHATAYAGYGKEPPLKALQKLANSAGYTRWSQAKHAILEVAEVVDEFNPIAKKLDIQQQTRRLISQYIERSREALLKQL